MGLLSSDATSDEDEGDDLPGRNAGSESDEEGGSPFIQSPNFQPSAAASPISGAASDNGSASPDQSDNSDASASSNYADSPASSAPTIPPRQRIPAKQIGQIPRVDESRIIAQSADLGTAWQETARQENARQRQIDQINQSDPYISPEDGRWKKQLVDYPTGAVHETDILDSGTGQIDRRTGNIQTQTAQGPQVISVDPQQKRLAEIVNQKAQARVQESPDDASVAAANSALSDTQRQLQAYQGVPERMAAQIAKYTQASLPPKNSAVGTQLQSLQTAFANWKQQNPGYAQLIVKRDALANQIQTQTATKAQSDAHAAQLLTTPQYVQWNGNTPPVPASSFGEQGTSTPSSDISIHDLDSRAGIIAAQTGYPAGLSYTAALQEARQQGAQTVDGSSIDDAIAGVQPVAEAQLPKMPGAQLSKALQAGLITRQQLITAVKPRNARSDQTAAPTDNTGANDSAPATSQNPDPVAQSVAGLTAKAADLRQKIQTAFDTGGADGARDLATYRAALADTEDQLHASAQSLLNRVPPDLQRRIANAVAPNIDWNDAVARNAQDPMANFATENIGSALREQSMPPYLQIAIRKTAIARGVNPDLAAHIANQALGEGAVRDLLRVLRGADIDPGRAQTLQDMGLLQPSDSADPASPLHLTEDAQRLLPPGAQRFVQIRPDLARYTPSPDPAHGSALYQNAVAGMERFSDTAEKTLPQPSEDIASAVPEAPADSSPSMPSAGAPYQNLGAGSSVAVNPLGSSVHSAEAIDTESKGEPHFLRDEKTDLTAQLAENHDHYLHDETGDVTAQLTENHDHYLRDETGDVTAQFTPPRPPKAPALPPKTAQGAVAHEVFSNSTGLDCVPTALRQVIYEALQKDPGNLDKPYAPGVKWDDITHRPEPGFPFDNTFGPLYPTADNLEPIFNSFGLQMREIGFDKSVDSRTAFGKMIDQIGELPVMFMVSNSSGTGTHEVTIKKDPGPLDRYIVTNPQAIVGKPSTVTVSREQILSGQIPMTVPELTGGNYGPRPPSRWMLTATPAFTVIPKPAAQPVGPSPLSPSSKP